MNLKITLKWTFDMKYAFEDNKYFVGELNKSVSIDLYIIYRYFKSITFLLI